MQESGIAVEVVTVPVFCRKPLVGSVEWLIGQKPVILLVSHPEGLSRQAVLVGEGGTPLARLAMVRRRQTSPREEGGEQTFLLDVKSRWQDTAFPWTDAAWEVLYQLRDRALALLGQPAWLAGAYRLQLRPADGVAGAMLQAQGTDPLARDMLYRYIVDELAAEEFRKTPSDEPPWPDGELRAAPNRAEVDEQCRRREEADLRGGGWVPF
jgi:hypothetical protein